MKIWKKRRSGSGIAQEPSTRDVVCWSAAILLPAAIYFSAAADLPHVLVITCLLLLFSSITRTGWRVTDRTTVYTVVFVGILTMFGNYLAPMKLDRFGFMAIFSRPMLLVPFSLYLAAMIAGFRNRGHVVGAGGAPPPAAGGPAAERQLKPRLRRDRRNGTHGCPMFQFRPPFPGRI